MLRLSRLLRRKVAPTLPALRVGHRRQRAPPGLAVRPGARPSRRRRRGGRAAGCRTAAPASARPRARARRRAACRSAARRRWRSSPSSHRASHCCQSARRRCRFYCRHRLRPCEGSSAPPATCRTGGSTAAEISGVRSGAAAGRARASVASYDEDTTTMGVEAARLALRSRADGAEPDALWFATVDPAYLDKTNATAIHAALRLDADVPRSTSAARSAPASARCAPRSTAAGPMLVVTADLRDGLPDERRRGRRRRRRRRGARRRRRRRRPVIAEYLGAASATEEFIDRWRTPGDATLEAVGGAVRRDEVRAARRAGVERRARRRPELTPEQVDRVIVTGTHARAVAVAHEPARRRRRTRVVDDLVGDRRQHRRRARRAAARRPRSSSAEPGRGHRAGRRSPTAPTCWCSARPTRSRRTRRRGRSRRRSSDGAPVPYGKFLVVARHGHGRAAAPARARPHLGRRSPGARGLEVRLRRVARPDRAARCTCRRSACRARATRSTTWSRRR